MCSIRQLIYRWLNATTHDREWTEPKKHVTTCCFLSSSPSGQIIRSESLSSPSHFEGSLTPIPSRWTFAKTSPSVSNPYYQAPRFKTHPPSDFSNLSSGVLVSQVNESSQFARSLEHFRRTIAKQGLCEKGWGHGFIGGAKAGQGYGVPMRSEGTGEYTSWGEAARSFTLARTPVPRWLPAAAGLARLAGTVIEYAGNAAAEYAISQMIRENSGCPGAILRELDRASLFPLFFFFCHFSFIRTHGHARARARLHARGRGIVYR